MTENSRRTILKLLGGPLDGCEIDTGAGVRNIDEVIFRTTELYPDKPGDIVYRRDAWGSLTMLQICDGMDRDAHFTVFRPAGESKIIEWVHELERRLRTADEERGDLAAKVEELRATNRAIREQAKRTTKSGRAGKRR
jgi:hypothetical protein